MTDNSQFQEEERKLRSQVAQARQKLEGLAGDLRALDGEIENLRVNHDLLEQACSSLEKLGERGVDSLFWGERIGPARGKEQLTEVRRSVSALKAQLEELGKRRQAIVDQINGEEEGLEVLGEGLYQVLQAEERHKLEWIVERDVSSVPHHQQVMAWTRGGEDDRRFRVSLATSLLACLLLALLFPMIDVPLPARFENDELLPERLAQFIRREQARPIPPPPVLADNPVEPEPSEQQEPEPVEPPETAERQPPPEAPTEIAAEPEPSALPNSPSQETQIGAPPGPPTQREVASAGILAFQEQIASLASDRVAPRLGADARLGNAENVSRASTPSRSMLTSNAPGSSGGIDIGSLSRNVGGGGGGGGTGGGTGGGGGAGGLPGVEVGRATSSIGTTSGSDRPKAGSGAGASRTDEEIQIVFDRYKAQFYRFYNRELRNNPTLQGQIVLRLTIEPDGSVSMCVVESTDMDSPTLSGQVVDRVRTIDFGAKEGVKALTITYPIDFLPATDA